MEGKGRVRGCGRVDGQLPTGRCTVAIPGAELGLRIPREGFPSFHPVSSSSALPLPNSLPSVSSIPSTRSVHLPSTQRRIDALLAGAEARWGRGALVRWGDWVEGGDIEVIPTGFTELDEAIGVGGLPCGRISELFGVDSSGKQALAASFAAQCQRQQGVVAWIDPAERLDPEQLGVLGVQSDALLIARPRNEIEALEMAVRLARSGGVRLIVFELHPSPFGFYSSLNLALRRLVAAVHKNRIAFLFIAGSADRRVSLTSELTSVVGDLPAPGANAVAIAAGVCEPPLPIGKLRCVPAPLLSQRQWMPCSGPGAAPGASNMLAIATGFSHPDSLVRALTPVGGQAGPPMPRAVPRGDGPHPDRPAGSAFRALARACAEPGLPEGEGAPSPISHLPFPYTHHSLPIKQHSKGGQALRYFASLRLEIERREWIRKGKEVVGCRSAVRVVKNKLAPPHREAEVELWFYRFPSEKPAVAAFKPARIARKHPR